ncbi:MAG: hypothetical protein ABIT83_15325 [Massilia sp.]
MLHPPNFARSLCAVLCLAAPAALFAQTPVAPAPLPALAPLPGKGLAEHPFLYCGEYAYDQDQQTVRLIKGGKEVWRYDIKFKVMVNGKENIQELGDCTQLSNGNIAFTTRFGAREVTLDKTVVWQYIGPDNTEIHGLQAIGLDRVLLLQNGNPAKALLINKKTNKIEKTYLIPVGKPDNIHGQMRRAHLTPAGTLLVAHMDSDKVSEYDEACKEVWTVAAGSPWDAVRLKNGNTLISSNHGFAREVNPKGETVWEFNKADAPQYTLKVFQEVTRLANGNTLISNWVAGGVKPPEWPKTVQFLEVTPDKKIVWALSAWDKPNLGPATSMQLLDQPGLAENGDLMR